MVVSYRVRALDLVTRWSLFSAVIIFCTFEHSSECLQVLHCLLKCRPDPMNIFLY